VPPPLHPVHPVKSPCPSLVTAPPPEGASRVREPGEQGPGCPTTGLGEQPQYYQKVIPLSSEKTPAAARCPVGTSPPCAAVPLRSSAGPEDSGTLLASPLFQFILWVPVRGQPVGGLSACATDGRRPRGAHRLLTAFQPSYPHRFPVGRQEVIHIPPVAITTTFRGP
jgi:hypothetical protein